MSSYSVPHSSLPLVNVSLLGHGAEPPPPPHPHPSHPSTPHPHPHPHHHQRYVITQSFSCSFLINASLDNGSTWNVRETPGEREDIRTLCQSATLVADTFFWLAVVLGIPGNLCAVFTLASMPKSTGTFYIALLGVVDLNSLLLKTAGRFLNTEGVRLGDAGCRTFMAVSNFMVTFANWTLVLICLERLVTIRFPLKKPVYFTIRRARYSAGCLAGCLVPFFVVLFFLYEESPIGSPRPCRTNPDLRDLAKVWNQIVSVLYSALPSILLVVHVVLITWALRLHKKRRESLMMMMAAGDDDNGNHGNQDSCSNTNSHSHSNGHSQEKISLHVTATTPASNHRSAIMHHTPSPSPSRRAAAAAAAGPRRTAMNTGHRTAHQRQQLERLERSVTGMSITAAAAFIVLTLPVCVLMAVPYDMSLDAPLYYARRKLASTVSRALVFLSHALNPYIYFMTCKKFRAYLKAGLTRMLSVGRCYHKRPKTRGGGGGVGLGSGGGGGAVSMAGTTRIQVTEVTPFNSHNHNV